MTTDRDWADKGWLRPQPERTPFPVLVMDVVLALFIGATLAALVVGVLLLVVPARAAGADWKAFLPLYSRHRDPVNPPRCPKWNVEGEFLEFSIAMQADGGEWFVDCRYGSGLKT